MLTSSQPDTNTSSCYVRKPGSAFPTSKKWPQGWMSEPWAQTSQVRPSQMTDRGLPSRKLSRVARMSSRVITDLMWIYLNLFLLIWDRISCIPVYSIRSRQWPWTHWKSMLTCSFYNLLPHHQLWKLAFTNRSMSHCNINLVCCRFNLHWVFHWTWLIVSASAF